MIRSEDDAAVESRREAFEIEKDEELHILIGMDSPPSHIGTRLCYNMCFIAIAALFVGIIILYSSADTLPTRVEDVELRDPTSKTVVNSTSGDLTLKASSGGNLTLDEQQALFKRVDNSDSRVISLYSRDVRDKLVNFLKKEDSFTILANGGSTTASAGHILNEELFFVRFTHALEELFDTHANIVNMGHGSRDSFHSFLMAESFFPEQVDLIIWELSMNDRQDIQTGGYVEARNLLIFWLSKVSQFYHPNPPPAILVYYWSSPFSNERDSRIQSDVFYAHDSLGAEFDFVLGHIHMGAFLDSLGWDEQSYRHYFLAEHDDHHPNPLGHALTAKLMRHLINDESLVEVEKGDTKSDLEWVCRVETHKQELIRDVLFEKRLVPKASFIADVPKN